MPIRAAALVIALAIAASAEPNLPPAANLKVDFKQHVLPVLSSKCFSCHGSKQQQSGLRLDKRQNALRGGDYGPVIVQGKSAESKLILRLVNGDGGLQMPPTGALDKEDISVLRAWIDQGADFGDAEIKDEAPKPVDPAVRALISAVRSRSKFKADRALVNGRDAAGNTALHHATGFGTVEAMRALIDAGAEVDAKNRFGQTPLHWAFTSVAKTTMLLDRGADVNALPNDGRGALYLAASQRHSDAVLRLLLDRGAKVDAPTSGGRTALMAAAQGGMVDYMKLLLAKGAAVDARSGTKGTALMDAATSRNIAAVQLLIDKGADVNARTKRNGTALSQAAMYGSTDIARLLIDKGADVNVCDERGYSALMYAAYAESQPAELVRLLLDKGADRSVSGEGETPVSLAAKRGDTELARLLGVPEEQRKRAGIALDPSKDQGRTPSAAIEKALEVVAAQSPTFLRKAGCNSCHNQNLPSASLALARQRGLKTPPAIAELRLDQVEKYPERAMDMSVAAIGSLGYELFGFASHARPADEYTDASVHYVKAMQTLAGNWQTTGVRPPLTSDDFITSAMAVNILRVYGGARDKADTAERMRRAAAWFDRAKAGTTQERTFKLLGLHWAGAESAAIQRAATDLAASQRTDGGWAQLPSMGSDAYATGQALYALHLAGRMPVSDEVWQRGKKRLLRTQFADGSWHVKTRSLPVQPYFESGFPYAHDQWISAAGTSWAAMALSLTVEQPKLSRR